MNKEVEEIEHDYINEDKAVNYISINGHEYVLGEFDTYEEALEQFEIIVKINNGGTVDWVSSRPGKNIK